MNGFVLNEATGDWDLAIVLGPGEAACWREWEAIFARGGQVLIFEGW